MLEQIDLFADPPKQELSIPKNTELIEEDPQITTTILYMSKKELLRFKELAKIGIKEMFNQNYEQKGNLTDFILRLLEEKYGDKTV